MAIPQVTMDGLTMFPGLKRQATDQVAVPKQGTTEMATERQVTVLEGQAVIVQEAVAAPDRAASATTD